MKDERLFFARRRAVPARLREYGFWEEDGGFRFCTGLLDGQFRLEVTVREEQVGTRLLDAAEGTEYILHGVHGAQGEFVGTVRAAYEAALAEIRSRCFADAVFQTRDAETAIAYMAERYGTPLEFLWEKFPDNAVCRRRDNRKWYAALLTVAGKKIGLDSPADVEILDLRIEPALLAQTIDGRRFFPGYHMNKKHWYTICLDGSVPAEELCRRIDQSYVLAGRR